MIVLEWKKKPGLSTTTCRRHVYFFFSKLKQLITTDKEYSKLLQVLWYLQSVLDLVGDEDSAVLGHGVVSLDAAAASLQHVHVPLRLEPRAQVLWHND